MTFKFEGIEWNPEGAVALAAACGILENHEKWLNDFEERLGRVIRDIHARLDSHEMRIVELELWKLRQNKGDEMILAREAEMLSLVNTFEQRLVELEKRIAEFDKTIGEAWVDIHLSAQDVINLEKTVKGISKDLSDAEVFLHGHAVLIRQLAARVGLSLYEQQRILHETSNQPHHEHTSQQTETTTKEN